MDTMDTLLISPRNRVREDSMTESSSCTGDDDDDDDVPLPSERSHLEEGEPDHTSNSSVVSLVMLTAGAGSSSEGDSDVSITIGASSKRIAPPPPPQPHQPAGPPPPSSSSAGGGGLKRRGVPVPLLTDDPMMPAPAPAPASQVSSPRVRFAASTDQHQHQQQQQQQQQQQGGGVSTRHHKTPSHLAVQVAANNANRNRHSGGGGGSDVELKKSTMFDSPTSSSAGTRAWLGEWQQRQNSMASLLLASGGGKEGMKRSPSFHFSAAAAAAAAAANNVNSNSNMPMSPSRRASTAGNNSIMMTRTASGFFAAPMLLQHQASSAKLTGGGSGMSAGPGSPGSSNQQQQQNAGHKRQGLLRAGSLGHMDIVGMMETRRTAKGVAIDATPAERLGTILQITNRLRRCKDLDKLQARIKEFFSSQWVAAVVELMETCSNHPLIFMAVRLCEIVTQFKSTLDVIAKSGMAEALVDIMASTELQNSLCVIDCLIVLERVAKHEVSVRLRLVRANIVRKLIDVILAPITIPHAREVWSHCLRLLSYVTCTRNGRSMAVFFDMRLVLQELQQKLRLLGAPEDSVDIGTTIFLSKELGHWERTAGRLSALQIKMMTK